MRFDNYCTPRIVGQSMDIVLGRFTKLWIIQPLGSTIIIIISSDDINHVNNPRNSLSEVCNA